MRALRNPYRGRGLDHPALTDVPWPSTDAERVNALLARCPRAAITPLVRSEALAEAAEVAQFWVKDERTRMGMGSFKALGAAYVIARHAEEGRAKGRTYVAATAGNHGLSVAAGAAAFGARARIFVSEAVPETFADRLRAHGADVVRAGAVYEDSMKAASEAAKADGAVLLSDSSWPGYTELPHILMEGYTALMAEVVAEMDDAPTHIFLQAGVGGLAAAAAAYARQAWGDGPQIVVVEPEAAPAILASIEAGGPVVADGPVSIMGRLDCKEPSLIALKGLARDADWCTTLPDATAERGTELAAEADLPSTPSGAAGIAVALDPSEADMGLGPRSRVLTILSEEA